MAGIKDFLKDILRPSYRSMLAAMHAGDECRCNLCGKRFAAMRPRKGRHADGSSFIIKDGAGTCWKCNSYPRVRALWHWLVNDFKIQEKVDFELLHIAPEQQLADKFLKMPGIHYTAVDKFCPGYKYANYVSHADVTDLHFHDSMFDMIICNHVLEHVKNDSKAMSELLRVLKPNGTAVLMVPIDMDAEHTDEEKPDEELSGDERERRFGQPDHVRMYGRDYFERLENVGFHVEHIAFPADLVKELALNPTEEVILAVKSN